MAKATPEQVQHRPSAPSRSPQWGVFGRHGAGSTGLSGQCPGVPGRPRRLPAHAGGSHPLAFSLQDVRYRLTANGIGILPAGGEVQAGARHGGSPGPPTPRSVHLSGSGLQCWLRRHQGMATHSAVGRLAAVLTIANDVAKLSGNYKLTPLASDGLPCSRPQICLLLLPSL